MNQLISDLAMPEKFRTLWERKKSFQSKTSSDDSALDWERIRTLSMGNESQVVDAYQRADEMVKYVAFKKWAHMNAGLIDLVERKIGTSINGAELEPEVVTSIRATCFKVTSDDYSLLPPAAQVLRRALPCLPLMWDSVEVGGHPHKPVSNAIATWDAGFKSPPTVKADFPETPAVCGRVAMSLVLRPVVHARKGKYRATSCIHGTMKWQDCLSLDYYNCICLEKCWVAALQRACELAPGCCANTDKAVYYDGIFSNSSRLGKFGGLVANASRWPRWPR